MPDPGPIQHSLFLLIVSVAFSVYAKLYTLYLDLMSIEIDYDFSAVFHQRYGGRQQNK